MTCEFAIIFRKNLKLYSDIEIRFELEPLKSSIYPNQLLNVSINPGFRNAILYIRSNSKYTSTVGFNPISLININNRMMINTKLKLDRNGNLNETLHVFYTTRDLSNIYPYLYINNLKFYSANSGYDYEPSYGYIIFYPGEIEKILTINLRSMSMLFLSDINKENEETIKASLDPLNANKAFYPRIFQVLLLNCTPNCAIEARNWISNVTIINQHFYLWRLYKKIINNDIELYGLDELEKMIGKTERHFSENELDLIFEILQNVIDQQFSLINDKTFGDNLNLLPQRQSKLIAILANLLWSFKSEDFDFNLKLNSMLENLFFASIGGVDSVCSKNETSLKFKKLDTKYNTFFYACNRVNFSAALNQSHLNYLGKYFHAKVPVIQYATTNNTLLHPNCYDICFVESESGAWLENKYNALNEKKKIFLLNGKLFLISLRPVLQDGSSLSNTNDQDMYLLDRFEPFNKFLNNKTIDIRMNFNKSVQSEKECYIFNTDSKQWQNNMCKTYRIENSIECKCSHQSIYALISQNKAFYYGFNFQMIYVSIMLKMLSLFFAVLTYFLFIAHLYTFFSLCLMQLMISTCLTQIFYLLTVSISPSIIAQEPYQNNASCSCLGAFFHYLILTQFTWIFISTVNYYFVLSKRTQLSPVYKVCTFFIGWLSPVLIVLVFYLITSLIYEYIYKYSGSFIYSDVFDNFDICFIKNLWAYLAGLILPSLALLVASSILFHFIFKDLKEWSMFDDIYLDHLNKREVIYVLVFYGLIICINILGAFQIRYGYFWLYFLICFLDIFLAVYVFVVFTLMRHIARKFFSENKSFFFNFKSKKLNFVKRSSSLPKNLIFKLELVDMRNLLKYIEKRDQFESVTTGKKSKEVKNSKELKKPKISWINTLDFNTAPNRAYAYYVHTDDEARKVRNRKTSSEMHYKEKKISFSSHLTQLEDDLFEMTTC